MCSVSAFKELLLTPFKETLLQHVQSRISGGRNLHHGWWVSWSIRVIYLPLIPCLYYTLVLHFCRYVLSALGINAQIIVTEVRLKNHCKASVITCVCSCMTKIYHLFVVQYTCIKQTYYVRMSVKLVEF